MPDLLRERALCEREQDCEPSREHGDAVDRARDSCISTHEREATPREPEPDVRVEAAPGELEVVGEDEKDPDGNENEEPGAEAGGADEADRAGGSDRGYGEPDKDPVRDLRSQRSATELVERMGADADREGEGCGRGAEPSPRDRRRQTAADHNVRDVPGGVRGMEQRHVVAPAS